MGAAVGGGGLLAGCSGEDVQRNRYASLTDCAADYSDGQCRPDYPLSGYATTAALLYYGPWYRSNRAGGVEPGDPGPGRFYSGGASGVAATGSVHPPSGVEAGSRGGFGSNGRVGARGG
jgi:hypothetical protein